MVSKEVLLKILKLFDELGMDYWLDGGWGVDVLYGRQTREHRDIDINFDASYTGRVLNMLKGLGYILETDWLPVRAELSHSEYGFLDIHPFDVSDPEHIRQANPQGGSWEFESAYFGEAEFEGRRIPCISLLGQKVFHSGYEPREQDIHDLKLLEMIEARR